MLVIGFACQKTNKTITSDVAQVHGLLSKRSSTYVAPKI